MFKEAMMEVLDSDLKVFGNMIAGVENLLLTEQERIGNSSETIYLRQLRRTIRGLEDQSIKTQAELIRLKNTEL